MGIALWVAFIGVAINDGLQMMERSGGRTGRLLVIGSVFFKAMAKVAIEQQMIGSQHEKKDDKRSGTILPFGIRNGTLFNIIGDVGRRFIKP